MLLKLEPFNDNHVLDIRVYLDKIVISEEEGDLLSICESWVSFFTFLNFFVNAAPVASLDSTGFFRGDFVVVGPIEVKEVTT